MKKNMGQIDKVIRLILASLFLILVITGVVEGTVAIVLIVLAVVFALTSLIGFCPLYRIFNISTCKK
jgi:hypothetical protein